MSRTEKKKEIYNNLFEKWEKSRRPSTPIKMAVDNGEKYNYTYRLVINNNCSMMIRGMIKDYIDQTNNKP